MASTGSNATTLLIAKIEQILQEGGTPQCSVWAELPEGEQLHQTIHGHPSTHTPLSDYEQNNTVLYNISSITKIFVAYAFVILVERLAQSNDPDCNKFRDLREAWDKGVDKYFDITLPGDPTIDNLLSHFKGLPSMNDFFLGPDGTVLITKDEFPKIVAHIAWEDYEMNQNIPSWRYSNGGYILAGILIETYSNSTLAQFLEINIFRPFKMTSTCANIEAFDKLPQGAVARPYVISTDLSAQAIEFPRYFGTPAFAAVGIYSCTKDLATFFRKLLSVLASNSAVADQDIEIVKRFLHPCVSFREKDRGSYSFCGHHTNMCTIQPGDASLNRAVTMPESAASKYMLGLSPNGLPLEVIYGCGTMTGYECCFYFMPQTNGFVIVLSNATGLVDTSDHISRLLLQELFDLKYRTSKLHRLTHKVKLDKSVKVDFVEKARLGAQERRLFMERSLSRDLPQTALQVSADFIGRYTNDECHQYILISYNMENVPQAQICGNAGRSKPLRIIPVDKRTVMLCKFPNDQLPFLSIDVFGDWKSLDLFFDRDDAGKISSLTRTRENFSVLYTRSTN